MSRQVLVARKTARILAALLMIGLLVGAGGLDALSTSAQKAHPFCFSDELLSRSLRQNPALQRKLDEQERAIRNYASSRRDKRIQQQTATSDLIIPVVVYVVHNGGPENISDQQVKSQIDALNNAFGGRGIQFCLATKQGNTLFTGSTPGIIRIQSPLTNHQTSQESALKALSTLQGDRYLRLFVVKDIDNNSGVAGYARFPGTVPTQMEGIVMRHDVFGDVATCGGCNLLPNYNQGKILAHEVGHYLYLYHTFQGGCTGLLPANCAAAGDKVCDTPQIAAANTGCPAAVTSCSGVPALLDNEMDYTNDLCRTSFTSGQEGRMLATVNTLRPLLVSAQNLVYTGVQCAGGLNASFSADNYNPCTNQVVTFGALPGASYAWDFGDGTTSTAQNPTHAYASGGTYTVMLTVTSGSNSVSSTQQVFVTACPPINSSQGNWYFGNKAGLNFSTGTPVSALGAFNNNTINTGEGSISQSDAAGNLLFYSDGINVWNNNHVLINPSTPLTGHLSGSQTALSVPVPGNANRYYLFTIPTQYNLSSPFAYSIVDVTGGNASLVTANIPITLPAGAFHVAEAATAVQKCNGDYWVIVRGYKNDPTPFRNSFYVYSVTASGVTWAGTYPFAVPSWVGQLKMSPDGTLLASSGGSAVICDFNRATGVLSNPRNFNKGDYGIAFSPNSRVFYIADYKFTGFPYYQTLYQYDLLNPNPASTERIVATMPDLDSSLQLGPDQKIYLSLYTKKHLAVINFPDNLVSTASPSACGFSYNGPSLVTSSSQGLYSQLGLPNMIDALPPAQIPPGFSYVTSSCSTVKFSAPACATSYAWDFGDSMISSVQNPTHTYATNGTYTAKLTLNGTTTVTHAVTIGLPASSATIYGPSGVCPTSGSQPFYNYSANSQPGLTYNWAVTGGAISGVSNSDNVDVVWNTLPGTVQLTVTDPATGCSTTKTLTVIQNCNPNQCIIPPAGMVDWWTFDETSGTTAQDLMGVFNNVGAHFNAPTPVAGVVDGALSFDGLNDYVEVANQQELNFGTCILDAAQPMTIDLWVKTDLPPAQQGLNSGLRTILDKRVNSGGQPSGYHLYLFNGRLGFQMDGLNYVAPATGPNYINIADNQWHFVAVSLPVCRGVGVGFLYVDGQNVLSLPRGPGFVNTAKLYIGRRDPAFGSNNFFTGAIDELEIFQSPLSEDELRAIFEARSRGKCKVDCSGNPSPCRKLPERPTPRIRP